MVPVTGLEPVRHRWRWILSPLRLPFHHTGSYISGVCLQFEARINRRDILEGHPKKRTYSISKKRCGTSTFRSDRR